MAAEARYRRIPDRVIDEIRSRTDIAEVIGQYVALRKAGSRYLGLCPFHDDHRPSLNVNPQLGLYKCFACGAGGNVFSFLRQHNGISFVEAVEELGRRCGVAVPKIEADASTALRETMTRVNELAARFFRERLAALPADAPAVRYLRETRALTPETIDRFELGFAPDSWQALCDLVRQKGLPLDAAVAVGLVSRSDTGRYFDKFRNRVVCPIRDPMGRLIGFSGRTLGDDPAKYINSADSPVFNKGRHFYALNLARDAVRRSGQAILVEGNFDVIRLHQAGIDNAIAALGTAITRDHVRALARLAEHIVLVLDGDEAGRKAALRAMETFLDADVEPRIVVLPEGEDPDSFVGRQGPEPLRREIAAARPIVERFLLDRLAGADRSVDGKTRAIRDVTQLLARMQNPVRRSLYTQLLADRAGVPQAEIVQAIGHAKVAASGAEKPAWQPPQGAKMPGVERALLQLVLHFPARLLPRLPDDVAEGLADPVAQAVVGACLAAQREGRALSPEAISGLSEEPAHQALISELLMEEPPAAESDADRLLDECVAKIRRDAATRERRILLAKLAEAEKTGDRAAIARLEAELARSRSAARTTEAPKPLVSGRS